MKRYYRNAGLKQDPVKRVISSFRRQWSSPTLNERITSCFKLPFPKKNLFPSLQLPFFMHMIGSAS